MVIIDYSKKYRNFYKNEKKILVNLIDKYKEDILADTDLRFQDYIVYHKQKLKSLRCSGE